MSLNLLRNNLLVEGVNTEAARVVTDAHKTTTVTLAHVGQGLIAVFECTHNKILYLIQTQRASVNCHDEQVPRGSGLPVSSKHVHC